MRMTTYATVTAVALGLGALNVAAPRAGQDAPAAPQTAADEGPAAPQTAADEGTDEREAFFALSGGCLRAKLARTQTTASLLSEGAWRILPGATLTGFVHAGKSDLFNITFSAEWLVRSLGAGDTARIRIARRPGTAGGFAMLRVNAGDE